jgi:hypothetical protein
LARTGELGWDDELPEDDGAGRTVGALRLDEPPSLRTIGAGRGEPPLLRGTADPRDSLLGLERVTGAGALRVL